MQIPKHLRGAARQDYIRRYRANRKPTREVLAAQQAAVAQWNAGVENAPSRMAHVEEN